ncbi:MAG: Ig-like domain-containing protein, partial [Candidatus Thermoplasmatota archaeon]|nr:Ig-like domain-containing protein [Candidatus Thermoplasmatota archaeon]
SGNWTNIADGQIIVGNPAQWLPLLQGTKEIEVSYEGFTDSVSVFVSRGSVNELKIISEGDEINNFQLNITADERIIVSLEAEDQKGNKWIINNANWSFSHPDYLNDAILDVTNIQQTIFSPIHSSDTPYILAVSVTEDGIIYSETFSVKVSVGDLSEFVARAFDSDGISYETNLEFDITADENIRFEYESYDSDGNTVNNIDLWWVLVNTSDQSQTNITAELNQNGLIWEATNYGEWQISYFVSNQRGDIFSYTFDINIDNGVPVELVVDQNALTQDAGAKTTLTVTAFDADGNAFLQPVTWLENNELPKNINQTDTEGVYEFYGRVAGSYQLTATYQTLSKGIEIEVFPQSLVSFVEYNISTLSLEQLEKITVQVNGFDEFGNSVTLPLNSRIDTTDRGEVRDLGNGVWELETLDEGPHSATIVVGSITETFTYEVEGNLAGFFAAGGPLYYVGAGLIALILLALLIFVVRLVRGGEDYYDDDEDEDYYQDAPAETVAMDFSTPRISQAPTVTTPPEQPPTEEIEPDAEEPEETEDTSWMADYRVDDEGTEWGQTEDGVWYYRESGSDDWIEWIE